MNNKIAKGTRFGKLVVKGFANTRSDVDYYFVNCDCGAKGKMVAAEALLRGYITSCGCNKSRDVNIKNPIFKHPLHKVWDTMKSRCTNPKRKGYYLYGGRGIKVCDEWLNRKDGYINFYNWAMNNGYKLEPNKTGKRNRYSLDRIDNNGDYCPENCRWVDIYEQNQHKRVNDKITFRGETKIIKDFLKEYNATTPYFYYLLKQGMTELEALEELSE